MKKETATKTKQTLKLVLWYESVTLISAAIMAVRYSWRILYAWWDYSYGQECNVLSEYVAAFTEELVRGLPTLFAVAVIALVAGVIHSYLRRRNA